MANEGHKKDFVDGRHFACDDPFDVDSDYEFDAASFFDFTRSETSSEARNAETWFDYADTYPPSRMFFLLLLFIS